MMFKAAMIVVAVLALMTAGLYWQTTRLSDKLDAAKIRAENAEADLKVVGASMKAQSAQAALKSAIEQDLASIEAGLHKRGTANDEIDPDTLDFLRSIGLLGK